MAIDWSDDDPLPAEPLPGAAERQAMRASADILHMRADILAGIAEFYAEAEKIAQVLGSGQKDKA